MMAVSYSKTLKEKISMRVYKITGTVRVSKDEVLDYFDIDDEDYEPTDDEWHKVAYEAFLNDDAEYDSLTLESR